jgi:hypothetical protein
MNFQEDIDEVLGKDKYLRIAEELLSSEGYNSIKLIGLQFYGGFIEVVVICEDEDRSEKRRVNITMPHRYSPEVVIELSDEISDVTCPF